MDYTLIIDTDRHSYTFPLYSDSEEAVQSALMSAVHTLRLEEGSYTYRVESPDQMGSSHELGGEG